MATIKDYISKPSEALEAMCDGLLKHSRRKVFEVNMMTYGGYQGETCFGCAATCTVQEVTGVTFTNRTIRGRHNRSVATSLNCNSVRVFEKKMDEARKGWLEGLFNYFGYNGRQFEEWESCWYMETENWKRQLPAVRKAIREMKAAGY